MAKLHSASSSVNIVPGVCSRGSRGGGWGRGLRDSSGGAWTRHWLIASWLWSAKRMWGALEVLVRSASHSMCESCLHI
jgi:hypothetical protein